MNETDWLLNNLNGTLPTNFADIKQSGFDFKLGDEDAYWKLDSVKNHPAFKNESGQPDKSKFSDFYNNNLVVFNEYKKGDFNITNFESNLSLDTPQNRRLGLPTFSNPIEINIDNKLVNNPFKVTKGFGGTADISDPKYSPMQLAKMQDFYVDSKTNEKIKISDRIGGIWDAITLPNLALAEDDKKDLKIDEETGTFYLETLEGKDSSGKQILTFDNMLTEEGSFANRNLDFIQSYGLDKPVVSTVLKTGLTVAPLLIPGVSTVYSQILLGKSLLDIGTEVAKTIDQSITGAKKDDPKYDTINRMQSTIGRFSMSSVSEAAKENPFNFESLSNLISNIATDISVQVAAAKTGGNLLGETGSTILSRIYNVGNANKEMMEIADQNNIDPKDRALLSLATVSLFSALYSPMGGYNPLSKYTDYVKNITDQNLEKNIIKRSIREYSDVISKELKQLSNLPEQAKKAGIFNLVKNVAIKTANNIKQLGDDIADKGVISAGGAAFAEAVEESSETTLSEVIKGLFNIYNREIGSSKDEEGKKFQFKDLFGKDYATELVLSALGGAVAGGGMQALKQIKGGTINKDLIELIAEGKTDSILSSIDKLESKSAFGSKDLSVESIIIDGKQYWKPATDNRISQNRFIADVVRKEVIKNDNFIKTLNAGADETFKTQSLIDSAFKNLINSELHTSLRSDNIKLIQDIIKEANNINNLRLATESTDKDLSDRAKIQLKEAQEKYDKLIKELNDNKIVDGKFNNLDTYVEQTLFGTYPYITKAFGLKTRQDFMKDGIFDEEGYKDYIANRRPDDIKKAIKQYKDFQSEENISKIKSLKDEDFKIYADTKNIEEKLDEFLSSEDDDVSIESDVIDESLLEKFEKYSGKDIESDLYSKIEPFLNNLTNSKFSSSLDSSIDISTLDGALKYIQDFESKYSTEISDINNQIKNLEEEYEDMETDENFYNLQTFKLYKDLLNNKRELDNSIESLKNVRNKKEYKIYKELSNKKTTNVVNKIDNIFKNVTDNLKKHKKLSKNLANYSSETLFGEIEEMENLIEKLGATILSFKTINPSMNNFRKTEEAKKYLPEEKLNIVDFELDNEPVFILMSRLQDYRDEVKRLKDLLADNIKNKLKYIINDQVVQMGRVSNFLKTLTTLNPTPTIDRLFNSPDLLDPEKSADDIKLAYKELSNLFKEFKSKYNEEIEAKIKTIPTAFLQEDGKKELSSQEALSIVNAIIRGDYDNFLARLGAVISDEKSFAPFYFQESSLFQIFSKITNNKPSIGLDEEVVKKASDDFTFVAENLISIDQPAGSGKTTLILKQAVELNEKIRFGFIAPTQEQLNLIRKNITESDRLKILGDFNDLYYKLFGDTVIDPTKKVKLLLNSRFELVPQVQYLGDTVNVLYEDGTSTTFTTSDVSEYFKDIDVIIIDEGTHLNPIAYYFLNKLNKPIISLLDTNQLGNTINGVYQGNSIKNDWDINSIIHERTAKQKYTVRNTYQGVPEAANMIKSLREEVTIVSKTKDNTDKSYSEIKSKYKIPVQKYLKDDFIGFAVDNDINKYLPLIKSNKEEVAFIYSDETKLAEYKAAYGSYGNLIHYKEVQGREFDYVFILELPEEEGLFSTNSYLKNLYTMITRSKKATYYEKPKDFKYQVEFEQLEDLKSDKPSIPLNPEVLKKYKEFKIKSLSEFEIKEDVISTPDSNSDLDVIKDIESLEKIKYQVVKGSKVQSLFDDVSGYIRTYTWYLPNKTLETISKKIGVPVNNDLRQQIYVVKNALIFGDSVSQKIKYLDDKIKELKSKGIEPKVLYFFKDRINKYEFVLNQKPLNDLLNDSDRKEEFFNGLDLSTKQMTIDVVFDDIQFQFSALPIIDDKRLKVVESGEERMTAFGYLSMFDTEVLKLLTALSDLIESKGSIKLDKRKVEQYFKLDNRGTGRIVNRELSGKSESISFDKVIKLDSAVSFSKPFVITKGEELRGRVAVLYSYNNKYDLTNLDETQVSKLYNSWKNKDSSVRNGIGIMFLNTQDHTLGELIEEFNANPIEDKKEFATFLNTLISNRGIKDLLRIVYELLNLDIKGTPSQIISKVRSIDPLKVTNENIFLLSKEDFEKFLSQKDIHKKVKIYPILKALKDVKDIDNILTAMSITNRINSGFAKNYLALSKDEKRIEGLTPDNDIAFIDGSFKTLKRVSPIEIYIDSDFFADILGIELKDKSSEKDPEEDLDKDFKRKKLVFTLEELKEYLKNNPDASKRIKSIIDGIDKAIKLEISPTLDEDEILIYVAKTYFDSIGIDLEIQDDSSEDVDEREKVIASVINLQSYFKDDSELKESFKDFINTIKDQEKTKKDLESIKSDVDLFIYYAKRFYDSINKDLTVTSKSGFDLEFFKSLLDRKDDDTDYDIDDDTDEDIDDDTESDNSNIIFDLDDTISEEDLYMSSKKIKSLNDIQTLRLGDNPFLFDLLHSNMMTNIILPSIYLDFEKGKFINEKDINDNIINRKIELLKNVLSYKSFNISLNSYTEVDALKYLLENPNKKAFDIITKYPNFREIFKKVSITELYKSYLDKEKENKGTTNQGKEINMLMPLIEYVTLLEFDNIIKYSENIRSLIKIDKKGTYSRKQENKFYKKLNEESSEINIMEVGTELFKSIMSNIPLVEFQNGKLIQRANLSPIQVTEAIVALKSLNTWTGKDIHNEIKRTMFEIIKPGSLVNILPQHRNILTSLYYFLYSDEKVTFVDKFNRERTFNSMFSILKKYSNDSLALKFQTAIENIFNVVFPNYQISIIKKDENNFTASNSAFNTISPSRAKIIESFLGLDTNELQDKNTFTGANNIELTPIQSAGFSLVSNNNPTSLGEAFIKIHFPLIDKTKALEALINFEKELNDIYLAYNKQKYERTTKLKLDVKKNKKLVKEEKFIDRVNKIAIAIDYINNKVGKSVQMSVLGTPTAKFTPTNNTLNVFDRSLRSNNNLNQGDLFDILNNCYI